MRVRVLLLVSAGCGRLGFDERGDVRVSGDAAIDVPPDAVDVSYPELVMGDGPVAYWRLGDTTDVAADEMGLYPGAYTGSFTRLASGAISDADGAVRFDDTATTTHMSVPDAPALRLAGSKALELWYNPNANVGQGTWPNVLSKGTSTNGYLLYYYPTTDTIHYRENTVTEVGADNVGMIATDWNHIVFVYDEMDHSNTLYVNDVRFDLGMNDWGTNAEASPLAIGTIRMSVEGTTSSVDEVAIYNHPLGAERVDAHYRKARP